MKEPVVQHLTSKKGCVASNIVGRGTLVGYTYVSTKGGLMKYGTEFQANQPVISRFMEDLASMAERVGGLSTEDLKELAQFLKKAHAEA